MKSIVFRSMKILNKSIVNFQNSLINGVNGLIDLTTRGNGFQLLGSQSPPQHLSIHSGSQNDLLTIFDSIFLFAVPKKKVLIFSSIPQLFSTELFLNYFLSRFHPVKREGR